MPSLVTELMANFSLVLNSCELLYLFLGCLPGLKGILYSYIEYIFNMFWTYIDNILMKVENVQKVQKSSKYSKKFKIFEKFRNDEFFWKICVASFRK